MVSDLWNVTVDSLDENPCITYDDLLSKADHKVDYKVKKVEPSKDIEVLYY
jgi:hypothetical protein